MAYVKMRPDIDWRRVQADLRTTNIPVRQLARLHNCSEGAIRKWMREKKFVRAAVQDPDQKRTEYAIDKVKKIVAGKKEANYQVVQSLYERLELEQVDISRIAERNSAVLATHAQMAESAKQSVMGLLAIIKENVDKASANKEGAIDALVFIRPLKDATEAAMKIVEIERRTFNILDIAPVKAIETEKDNMAIDKIKAVHARLEQIAAGTPAASHASP